MNSGRKHIVIGVCSLLISYLIVQSRNEWAPLHAWNRAFADVSLFMLGLVMIIGPIVRFLPSLKVVIVWRRTLGVWSGILALIHTIIILNGWVEWDFTRLFFIFTPFGQEWILHPGFALANVIGIIAVLYYLILMITSNNLSIKLLGNSAWNYLQSKTSTLYLLVLLHTLYFLYFHRPENHNWVKGPFIATIVLIFLFQITGFAWTVRNRIKKR
ncbi:MAG: ferric reductase-like transmembrane domain-containing protein [Bacillota bacterium]|nr:ferric reductase-like transmembrane domain-containing protein [Bacillota bacterium]